MANKKKKVVNTKIHIKSGVKYLAIFIAILTILGLIFMNFLFTVILVVGILLIIWISDIMERKKRRLWVRIILNSIAILLLLAAIAGVGAVA
jgi:4-hydroxybenzoate polyprenyltransferase